MALSYITYTGDGSTKDFTFPFMYLDAGDIGVFVGSAQVAFTLTNASAVKTTVAPASGQTVRIRRLTSKLSVPVNFSDGSNLLERDLDLLGTWTLYQAQEAADVSSDLGLIAGQPLDTAIAAAVQANASAGQASTAAASAVSSLTSLTAVTGAGLVGFTQAGTGAVARNIRDVLREFVRVKDFGAVCDGVTDDATALTNANAAAFSARLPLLITGVMHTTTPVTVTASLMDVRSKLFTVTGQVTVANGMELRPEWWGADPTGVTDSLAAWNAVVAVAQGRVIRVSGMYKLSGTLTINYGDLSSLKILGGGARLLNSPGLAGNKYGFNFDGVAANSKGLDIRQVRGLVLEDFFVSYKVGSGNGVAVHLRAFDNFSVRGVAVDFAAGATASAFRFGETDGVDCVFMGNIQNCKVISNGQRSFDIRNTCTSLDFSNCYQIGGWWDIQGVTYCNFTSCAGESAPLFSYTLTGSIGVTFNSCGGEMNGRGVFYMQSGCKNISINSPVGITNNTSGIAGVGDLVHLDASAGANYGITVNNPTSLNPNASTTASIYSAGTNGITHVNNSTVASMPRGVGGDAAWQRDLLTVVGDGEYRSFTPTLNAGWTNSGTPALTGKYIRKGKMVSFWIDITPATSIKSTGAASQIVMPWAASAGSAVGVVDGNALGYVSGVMSGVNIFMPVTAVLTVPLTVSGTMFTG